MTMMRFPRCGRGPYGCCAVCGALRAYKQRAYQNQHYELKAALHDFIAEHGSVYTPGRGAFHNAGDRKPIMKLACG